MISREWNNKSNPSSVSFWVWALVTLILLWFKILTKMNLRCSKSRRTKRSWVLIGPPKVQIPPQNDFLDLSRTKKTKTIRFNTLRVKARQKKRQKSFFIHFHLSEGVSREWSTGEEEAPTKTNKMMIRIISRVQSCMRRRKNLFFVKEADWRGHMKGIKHLKVKKTKRHYFSLTSREVCTIKRSNTILKATNQANRALRVGDGDTFEVQVHLCRSMSECES